MFSVPEGLSVRIRLSRSNSMLRVAALAASVSVGLTGGAEAQQLLRSTQDTSGAVNQGSPVTERILSELRAGRAGDDAATPDSAPDTAAEGDATAKPAKLRDGILSEPQADPVNADGLLGTQDPATPADGDLSADGVMTPPTENTLTDDAAGEQPLPSDPAPAPPLVRADARSLAGRPRQLPAPDRAPVPAAAPVPAPAADGAGQGDAQDEPADPPPSLRPRIVDTEDNPYAPVGYRLGGFRLLPGITGETVHSDNVLKASSDRRADVALVLRPSLLLESQWSRHSVTLDLHGRTSSYASLKSQDERLLFVNLRPAVAGERCDNGGTSGVEAEFPLVFQ